jgi:hypothetical protein
LVRISGGVEEERGGMWDVGCGLWVKDAEMELLGVGRVGGQGE